VFTWSFISEISGDITIDIPSNIRAGIRKQIDFPAPVGITPTVSFPAKIFEMKASCPLRKLSYPKYCFKTLSAVILLPPYTVFKIL
jgi:hypothetical protein